MGKLSVEGKLWKQIGEHFTEARAQPAKCRANKARTLHVRSTRSEVAPPFSGSTWHGELAARPPASRAPRARIRSIAVFAAARCFLGNALPGFVSVYDFLPSVSLTVAGYSSSSIVRDGMICFSLVSLPHSYITQNFSMDLRSIYPRGGDQRSAFEELSYLLFTRDKAGIGIPIRRHGDGGDAGLEGAMVDRPGCVLSGIQAKFYKDKLGSSQWRDLTDSVQTALRDNAADGMLREIVITFPVNLNQTQQRKWDSLAAEWREFARATGFKHDVIFTLWPESRLRDLLLQSANRGLLLHYFEIPDFDATHCARKTRTSLKNLGDRYQPDLHTPTEAEDILHTFLRSERCRLQYIEEARERITGTSLPPPPDEARSTNVPALHQAAEKAWQEVLPLLGDGISLPASFGALKNKLDATVDALTPLIRSLYELIPAQQEQVESDFRSYHRTRTPAEEAYDQTRRWSSHLNSFSRFLEEHAHADRPCLLLTGAPGMGKTQVLAEICNRYREQGGVVLFREAALFTSSDTPWNQLLRWADFPRDSIRDFLETISAAAASTGLPALLCIDALNETPDRHLWRGGLQEFAAEIPRYKNIKLIVSCRSDYLRQTLPEDIRENRVPEWHCAEHEGLGVNVFEALPKYLSAYGVRGIGVPPLAAEFENPLFLLTFCEAFKNEEPPSGSVSLHSILHRYAQRKAESIKQRIDCDLNKVRNALRQLAKAMQDNDNLLLPEDEAQKICQHQHAPTETTRSLYRALLAESILAETPAEEDVLGTSNVVRFTYERIWDYFLSLDLLLERKAPSPALLARLADPGWCAQNSGVVGLLTLRLAEEGHGELYDLVSPGQCPPYDLLEAFLDSLPWRTHKSVTKRTRELFLEAVESGAVSHEFDSLLRFAPNPAHPWNAHHLHERLAKFPLADRDREWTLWINEELIRLHADSPLHTLLNWAERGRLKLIPDDHIYLLATAIAWCLSTTVVELRVRVANALTRLLVGRLEVATRIVERFLSVDDPYVQEYVLLAAAGAAQHAPSGDPGLTTLAATVHAKVFAGKFVSPHFLVRHYATEICQQAQQKGALPPAIAPASFRALFRSRWPKIWTAARLQTLEKRLEKDRATSHHAYTLFRSVEPGPHPAYGNFGRYVMAYAVGHFQKRRLTAAAAPKGRENRFDSQVAKRYVLQRVFELGWNPASTDQHPTSSHLSERPKIERLSKKYQWIALHELLAHLTDHFHFSDYQGNVRPFQTAADVTTRGLLDPFVVDSHHPSKNFPWQFQPPALPWWRGRYDPLPRPLSQEEQRQKTSAPDLQDPAILLALKDDAGLDWLTLSCFHEWNEPLPLWRTRQHAPYVKINWDIQSYLVKPAQSAKLLARLKRRDFPSVHHNRMDEPKFEGPLAALRTYPEGQDDLREACELDELWDSQYWGTGAWSTTCQLEEEETHKRFRGGSFPSPQLARLGALHWTGQSFDFADRHGGEPVACHHGGGYKGACVVRRASLLEWLRREKLQLVWRCFSEKHRYNEPHDEPTPARYHWAAYTLTAQGEVVLISGGTCTVRNGLGPEEPLPWQKEARRGPLGP